MPAEWIVAEPYTYSCNSDPAAAPSGVQCRLATVAGATAPAPLHDWTTCASPRSYAALPDASYVFSVRAEDVGGVPVLLWLSFQSKTEIS